MLKNYPATQLLLLSLIVLMAMAFITPFVREWYLCAAMLDSLKFVVKVICGLLLIGTVIDLVDGINFWRQKHSR